MLPRPKKCRRVCGFPQTLRFAPPHCAKDAPEIVMTVEEYETIRLIDKEGLSQEQCGEYMDIARTTVQHIYASARKKIADAIVEGVPFRIGGGNYVVCGGNDSSCKCGECFKYNKKNPEGDNIMRIAVTYENGQIFQHFGHTEQFKVYDVEDGKVVSSEVVGTNGSGHGALAGVLGALGADILICGGIGGGARNALAEAGIKLYGGVSGDADAAVRALLDGTLEFDPDVMCSHHGEHHHEGHTCGNHGCGSHNCGN